MTSQLRHHYVVSCKYLWAPTAKILSVPFFRTRCTLSVQLHVQAASIGTTLRNALASRFLGDRSSLGTVVVPQTTQYLSGDHLAHVHADQPDDEHSVSTQIVLGKFTECSGFAWRGVHDANLLANVLDVPGPVECAKQPAQEVDRCNKCHKYEPKPDKDENLLVKEVDGKSALNDVVVYARLMTYLELAQSNAREPVRVAPVQSSPDV